MGFETCPAAWKKARLGAWGLAASPPGGKGWRAQTPGFQPQRRPRLAPHISKCDSTTGIVTPPPKAPAMDENFPQHNQFIILHHATSPHGRLLQRQPASGT